MARVYWTKVIILFYIFSLAPPYTSRDPSDGPSKDEINVVAPGAVRPFPKRSEMRSETHQYQPLTAPQQTMCANVTVCYTIHNIYSLLVGLRSKHYYLVVILLQAQPQGDTDTTQESDINITLFIAQNKALLVVKIKVSGSQYFSTVGFKTIKPCLTMPYLHAVQDILPSPLGGYILYSPRRHGLTIKYSLFRP